MTPLRWYGRALLTAVTLMTAGWALGFSVSWLSSAAALALGGTATLLVAAPWAVGRLGGAGLAAALLGLLAAIGAAIGGHQWWLVSRVPLVDAPTLEPWPVGVVAVRLPSRLVHEPKLRGAASWSTRSGKSSAHHYQAATPLVAEPGGPVVAFDCHDGLRPPDPDGVVLLSWSAWADKEEEFCARPIAVARQRIAEAGRVLAPGAERRVVRVFEDEAQLRRTHDVAAAFAVPLWGFALYAVLCAVFMRAGARSV